jgi:hypothetical protein
MNIEPTFCVCLPAKRAANHFYLADLEKRAAEMGIDLASTGGTQPYPSDPDETQVSYLCNSRGRPVAHRDCYVVSMWSPMMDDPPRQKDN